jgi:hypothetical protein
MESSPRIGIICFISAEPFGNAPAHITVTQSAVAKPLRENTGHIHVENHEGNTVPAAVQAHTAADMTTASK